MTIRGMTVTNSGSATHKCLRRGARVRLIIGLLIVLVCLAALSGYYIGVSHHPPRGEPPDPIYPPLPSASRLHMFQRGAVCTDSAPCSKIGKEILARNGSAVDSAIAAMFCNGLLNQQSMGIGGGFFMTVYVKSEGQAYSVIAREVAPGAAHVDMFNGDSNKASKGPLAVGVPGEVRGLWAAHKRWGVLPWSELMKPTLGLCRDGYIMSKVLYDGLLSAPYIVNDSQLRKMYYDEKRKAFYPPGKHLKPSEQLCNTFKRISENGGDELYNGSLSEDLVSDLNKMGSIITAEDLARYQPNITKPVTMKLTDGDILYTPPPPSSGVLLAFILNVLKGYEFTGDDLRTDPVLSYHRILEAFKYAYATRTKLGDAAFVDLRSLIEKITSTAYGESIRRQISDDTTSNSSATYGAVEYARDDAGTAHVSIIAPNGDAVSVTSSINYYYGAGFAGAKTGVIFNNVMDDFSSPGIINYFGLRPSKANFIMPYKRPQSSMCPSIIVDSSGNAKLVIGASGGTKITTAITLVAVRQLWFKQSIKEAVDAPRIHHQIFPMNVQYEYGLTEDVVAGLRSKGHGMTRYRDRGSIICAIFRNKTAIYANADFRKGGDVVGFD